MNTPQPKQRGTTPVPADANTDPGTRDRILATAVQLLSERGHKGTSLAALLEESGTTKGSLYHFFPEGKSQCVAEALSLYSFQMRSGLDARFAKAPTPGAAVADFIEEAARRQESQNFTRSCPIGAVALDVAPDDPLASHCNALFDDWAFTLAGYFQSEDQNEGRALAEWVIASFEGALLLSRVRRSAAPLCAAAKRLRAQVDASRRTT